MIRIINKIGVIIFKHKKKLKKFRFDNKQNGEMELFYLVNILVDLKDTLYKKLNNERLLKKLKNDKELQELCYKVRIKVLQDYINTEDSENV